MLDDMAAGMTRAKLTDSISHTFIVQTIFHHQAAIEMFRAILRYAANVPIRGIAEQNESIGNMRKIAQSCGMQKNAGQDICLYQYRVERMMDAMFTDMKNARSAN